MLHNRPLLTHWGRVTHICVSNITTIVPDNGLSPDRRRAIIWTNTGMLLIRTLGTNCGEILSEIHIFSFMKMHLKMSSAKWRPFCLGRNVLIVVRVTACRLFGTKALPEPIKCNIIIKSSTNNHQWNFNQNIQNFNEEMATGNVVCKISAILFMTLCIELIFNRDQ